MNTAEGNINEFADLTGTESEHCWPYTRHIAVQTTLYCPLKCNHCVVNAHNKRDEDMSDEIAESLRIQMSECDDLEAFTITGGEPFTRIRMLEEFCRYAKDRKLKLNVFTSAFWAVNESNASRLLAWLSGLTRLIISAGHFYSGQVPLSNLRNAALAAFDRGIKVGFRIFPGKETDYIKEIKELFHGKAVDQIEFSSMAIQARGRAVDLPLFKDEERVTLETIPYECCGGLSSPFVGYNGTVMACTCFVEPDMAHPMRLGNIRDNSLAEILRKVDKDFFIHALRLWGTKGVLDRLKDKTCLSDITGRYSRSDPCGPCIDIFSNRKVMDSLMGVLNEPDMQRTIALGRALRYGEHAMLNYTRPF